jgi:uracil-DNA glycosylase
MNPPSSPEPPRSGPSPGLSTGEELAHLADGLRATIRRRRWAGEERVPLPAPPERPAPASPASPAPPDAASPDPEEAPGRPEARDPGEALAILRAKVAACTACELSRTRTQTVFGDGSGAAGVLFIGEAPGQHEDEQGVPFVGRAGALLTDIIQKGMGLRREDVCIANVLKCRPPGNRDPRPEETRACTPFLDRQIELLDPKILITLGRHASQHILGGTLSMGRMRGRVHQVGGRKVVATYHPAYLLRSPEMKKECWKDIQLAMAELGLAPPGGGEE